MEHDLKIISGDFLEIDLPKDKKYLLKYFKTDLSKKIAIYYFHFKNIDNFVNHTGYFCEIDYMKKCVNRYKTIEKEHDEALKEFDFEKMEKIQNGTFKIKSI